MIEVTTFAGEPVAVMGLARSGLTAAVALRAGGAEVLAWDDKIGAREAAKARGVPLVDLAAVDWSGIEALVLSPGIPHTYPKPHAVAAAAIAAGTAIICDVDLLARAVPEAKYVGITGTNGKSTTTALVGHILARAGIPVQVGGNIGTPVLELDRLPAHGVYVLELSSYQLERIPSVALDVAVLLNITPDHLDRHGGMDGYVAAKRLIFDRVKPSATAVVSLEDVHSRGICLELMAKTRQRIVPISTAARAAGGVWVENGLLIDDMERAAQPAIDLTKAVALPGRHNWQNAAAAYAVARTLGVPLHVIAQAMETFPGLAHRQEKVRTIGRVAYINDSKATNTDSAARALACYDNIHWLAGGEFKEEGLGALVEFLPRVRAAYLFGKAAPKLAGWLKGSVPVVECGAMDVALPRAHAAAQASGADAVVLLSPACASFDQFRDFEDRGDQFRAAVAALDGGAA
jgi:UDP-N-acetylmuramoylalanine--D-glutamate ligase